MVNMNEHMETEKSIVGLLVEFLQKFENEWFLGFFTKVRFFDIFVLLNFDTLQI